MKTERGGGKEVGVKGSKIAQASNYSICEKKFGKDSDGRASTEGLPPGPSAAALQGALGTPGNPRATELWERACPCLSQRSQRHKLCFGVDSPPVRDYVLL